MGRRGYPPEFRHRVLDLIEAGRKIADVARDLGVSQQTIYTWRRQDRIDRGLEPGTTTAENQALAAANKRIRELETELEIARRSVDTLKETTDPKGGTRRSR
jgi:transposase